MGEPVMGHKSTFTHCQNVIKDADSPTDRSANYWRATARELAVVLADTTGYIGPHTRWGTPDHEGDVT